MNSLTLPKAKVYGSPAGTTRPAGQLPGVFTKAQLMDMQGDLMLWCPALKPNFDAGGYDARLQIRRVSDRGQIARGIEAGWVWTTTIGNYPPNERQIAYEEAKQQGWTHWALHVAEMSAGGGYHGIYPVDQAFADGYGALMNTVHAELIAAGLIPVVAGPAPLGTPGGARLAAGFNAAQVLIAMSDWDNTNFAADRIRTIAETFPQALLYFERPQNASRAEPDPSPADPEPPTPTNGGSWIRGIQQRYPNFVGVLYEVNHPDGLDLCIAELKLANGWWRDVQQVLFESDTYWKFWDNLDRNQARDFNDHLLSSCPWLHGCMSGASMHTPIVPSSAGDIVIAADTDMINIDAARVVEPPDFRHWPITTKISRIEIRVGNVHVDFDKRDSWPTSTTPGWMGALQYSLGMALLINGVWYLNAPIEVWKGLDEYGGAIQSQTGVNGRGQIPANWFYNSRWGIMNGYQPQPGELIGLFVVAGDARNQWNPLHERSNVVVFPLPNPNETATFTFQG